VAILIEQGFIQSDEAFKLMADFLEARLSEFFFLPDWPVAFIEEKFEVKDIVFSGLALPGLILKGLKKSLNWRFTTAGYRQKTVFSSVRSRLMFRGWVSPRLISMSGIYFRPSNFQLVNREFLAGPDRNQKNCLNFDLPQALRL